MKRLISIFVSLLILALIYWKIDARGLAAVFKGCDPLWMGISLGMVVPLTLLTSWRLQRMAPGEARLSFGEANKLTLSASVLNMVLPSKMGDMAKAWFMRDRGHLSGSLALSLVVFEKACDMLSLLLWCIFGLLLYPQKDLLFWGMTAVISGGFLLGLLLLGSRQAADAFFGLAATKLPGGLGAKCARMKESWGEMHQYFWSDHSRLVTVVVTSIFLWFLHLVQIWLFTVALGKPVPFLSNLALAPLAILAGLLPMTFAGVGTRDGALIYFFRNYLDANTAAALGLLCTARYVLPALAGLPFLGEYLSAAKQSDKNVV